jgi:hypothetical protein
VAANADWLATSRLPKLFVKAEPGALLAAGANLDFVREWPAQAEVTVAGVHFLQEDSAGRGRASHRRLDVGVGLMGAMPVHDGVASSSSLGDRGIGRRAAHFKRQ